MVRRSARILTLVSVLAFASGPTLCADTPSDNVEEAIDRYHRAFETDAVPVLEDALAAVLASSVYRGALTVDEAAAGMLRGLVATLDDPYAGVLVRSAGQAPPTADGNDAGRTGASHEQGLILELDAFGRLEVGAVLAGSPAERAGVRTGDLLLRIGARNVADHAPWEVLPLLSAADRGPLNLVVARAGETLRVRVEPGEYEMDAVTLRIGEIVDGAWSDDSTGSVAWLRVHAFVAPLTQKEWSEAVAEIWRAGGVQSLVLDLRDNGGGDNACIEALGDFFPGGAHLVTFDALVGSAAWSQRVTNAFVPRARLISYPLAVLVNGGTASLAEIFAAALAEGRDAPLIGGTTYGKGTTQTWVSVGERYALHITTGAWRTPAGRSIDGVGLTPDVPVRATAADGAYIRAAAEALAARRAME